MHFNSAIKIFLFLLLSFSISAQEEIQTIKDFGMTGNVKSLEEFMKASDNGNITISAYERTLGDPNPYYVFNEKGFLILHANKTKNDSLVKRYEYHFDNKNRLIKNIYFEKNRRYAEGRIFYNEHGDSVMTVIIYWNGDTAACKTYSYDSNYKRIGHGLYHTSFNNVSEQWTYFYDVKGRKIKELALFKREGKKEYIRTFKYNDKNQVTEMKDWHGNYKYAYDAKGNLISAGGFSASDGKETFRYNASGIKVEENVYGVWGVHEYKWLFDDKGNKIKEIEYGPKGIITATNKYVYEFDTKGNWIKQSYYLGDKLYSTIKRKITYY